MQQIRTMLNRCLHLSILSVFFFGPTYLQLYWKWLPESQYGLFAIVVPVYVSIGIWLLLGLPGINEALTDSRWRWLVGIFAFTVWAWLSIRWSLFPDVSQGMIPALAISGLFAFITASVGPSSKAIMIALAAGIIIQAVVSIGQMAMQHPLGMIGLGEYVLKPNNLGLSVVASGSERIMRAYGLGNHPNILGGYFAFATLSLIAWLTEPAAHWRRIVQLLIFMLGQWGLYISFSRSAWVAFVVGLISLVVLWWRKKPQSVNPSRRTIVMVTACILLTTLLFFVLYGRFVITRTGSTSEPTELRSISDRTYYTRIAIQAIQEHPILGIGAGTFSDFAKQIISTGPYANDLPADYVHNVPLLIFSELGLVGFVFWLGIWVINLFSVWRKQIDPYSLSLTAGIAALLVTGLFDHFTWTRVHFMFMLWGAMGVVLKSSAANLASQTEV
jgi:hypothetical protein